MGCNRSRSLLVKTLGVMGSGLLVLACGGGVVATEPATPARAEQPTEPRGAEVVATSEVAAPPAANKPPEAEPPPTFDGPIEAAPVNAEGQWLLSQRYWSGVGVTKTPSLSYAFARQAAGNGSAPALAWLKARAEADSSGKFFLGLLYVEGPESLRDKPRGEAMLREALAQLEPRAAKGDADANGLLGISYQRALGSTRDTAKGRAYLERAAGAQEPESMNLLGDIYYFADGVPKDLVKAADWYRRAAQAGSSAGLANYAYALHQGEGVKADLAAARSWYQAASERGQAIAQRNLALLLLDGNPAPALVREAIGWCTRAANQDDPVALLQLARLYAEGRHAAKDLPRAKELAARSAQLGNERSKQWLAKLDEREKCQNGADTKLFDIALACADRGVFRGAIVSNGGKAQREDDRYWYDVYDSAGLLTDSVKLSVGYTNAGDFATAEYDFGEFVGDDKLDRTLDLLFQKYGTAQISKTRERNLATWTRRDGIVIELARSPRNMFLRYFKPARVKQLDQEMAAEKGEQRRREIAKQSRAF